MINNVSKHCNSNSTSTSNSGNNSNRNRNSTWSSFKDRRAESRLPPHPGGALDVGLTITITILCCNILYYTVLYYTILYYTIDWARARGTPRRRAASDRRLATGR